MKRIIHKLGLITLITVFLLSMAVSATAQTPTTLEEEVFVLINNHRAQNGLSRLLWCNFLGQVAREHSVDMATHSHASLISNSGLSISQRVDGLSQVTNLYNISNGNIAVGVSTAQAIVDMWMNTPEQRANILNASFTHMGTGFHATGNRATVGFGGGRTAGVAGVNPDVGTVAVHLPAPVITLTGSVISWPNVAGAAHYDVFVNGQFRHSVFQTTTQTTFDLATLVPPLTGATALPIHIVASNAGRTSTGVSSNIVYFTPQPVLPPYTPVIRPVTPNRLSFENRQFQVFDTGFTWEQARDHAEYLGGNLATITSTAEQQFIISLLQAGTREHYWLGGYRIANTGANQFAWVTGEQMTFTNWAAGQPSRGHEELGGENRIVITRADNRWRDKLTQGIPIEGTNNIERRNLGFIVEWGPDAVEEDGPSISAVTLNPTSLVAGETVTINATGIEDAVRAEFLTRTAGGAETVIHNVQNPGTIVTRTFETTDHNVNQIIVRVHDADGYTNQIAANIDIQPLEGDEAPEPDPDPTPEPPVAPPLPDRPAPQFRNAPTVTDLGVLIEWMPTPGNQFGYRVFRASSAAADGAPTSHNPIMGQNNFRPGGMVTFDPNATPGVNYYYIREVLDATGNLGAPSQRAQVIVPHTAAMTGGNRGFILMTIGNPWMNANNQWGQIDPGVGTTPGIANGRTMVPIRAVVEAMGGTVAWDSADTRADLFAQNNHVQLWLGRTDLRVNGQQATMDVAPANVNDRILLPLRFATEGLGAQPYWIASQQMAVIVFPN